MDLAWALEQEFWQACAEDGAAAWFARHLTTDAFVVLPRGVVHRESLIAGEECRGAVEAVSTAEPAYTLVEGANALLTYEISAKAEWLGGSDALITALYSWSGGGWALVCRTHTPRA